MDADFANDTEMHPLFPSGEWEGFYTYHTNSMGEKSEMAFFLNFSKGKLEGGGSDNIGGFSWKGTYNLEALTCKMTKSYAAHDVFYEGNVDENGIWGVCHIPPYMNGGFHIWPKKTEQEAAAAEEYSAEKVLEKSKSLSPTNQN